jgi:hypothetical protein
MMKNLAPYNLFEDDKPPVKSERKLLGFALSTIASYDQGDAISSYLVVGSAYTFQEFAFQVLEDLHGMEPEDISDSIKDIGDVDDEVYNFSEPSSYESMFWYGLEPVSNEAFYDSISLDNPVMASQLLRKYFSNSEVIMARDRNGNSNDNTYIIKSIKNSPELLFRYENDGARYNDIISNLGFTEDQIRSLKSYSQIKNQL